MVVEDSPAAGFSTPGAAMTLFGHVLIAGLGMIGIALGGAVTLLSPGCQRGFAEIHSHD